MPDSWVKDLFAGINAQSSTSLFKVFVKVLPSKANFAATLKHHFLNVFTKNLTITVYLMLHIMNLVVILERSTQQVFVKTNKVLPNLSA